MGKLTARQQRFVEEFPIDFNGTQAAIRAGYAPRSATTAAARLLANDKVSTALSKEWAAIRERNKVTVDRLIEELAPVAFSRLTDVVSWDSNGVTVKASEELGDSALASIKSVRFQETATEHGTTRTIEVKMHDKLAALEKLAKHLGFYDAKPQQAPIRVEIVQAIPDFEGGSLSEEETLLN